MLVISLLIHFSHTALTFTSYLLRSMAMQFSLGKLFGITISVDISWLIIFVLLVWNLAFGFLPGINPNWSPALTLFTAVAVAILFFGSVILHELAHSLVAKAKGIEVKNITLFIFGGVASISREPPSPKAEFLMAIVGPLTSIGVGILSIGLTFLFSDFRGGTGGGVIVGGLSPLATILLWLGSVNILVGLFNLTPGFPLDGGRVVRSIIWGVTKDLEKATRYASYIGQGIAWLLILNGVLIVLGIPSPIFGSNLITGFWIAFIGWYLNSAASRSYQSVLLRTALKNTKVDTLVKTSFTPVKPDYTVAQLLYSYVIRKNSSVFPVATSGQVIGIITLKDIRRVPKEAWQTTRVKDIMTSKKEVLSTSSNEPLTDAMDKINRSKSQQLPVVDNGTFKGFVHERDIIWWAALHGNINPGD